MFDVNLVFCCFNYLNAYTIETFIFIFSIIGLFYIFFFKSIYLRYLNSKLLEYCFLILETFFLISPPLLLIPIIFYRMKKLINLKKHKICQCYSIATIILSLLGFIIAVLFGLIVLVIMNNYINKAKRNKNMKKITNDDIIQILASFIVLCLIWIIILLLTSSELLRIKLKINASYKSFLYVVHEEVKTGSELIKFEPKTRKVINDEKKKKNNKINDNNSSTNTSNNKDSTSGVIKEINEVIINPLDNKFI